MDAILTHMGTATATSLSRQEFMGAMHLVSTTVQVAQSQMFEVDSLWTPDARPGVPVPAKKRDRPHAKLSRSSAAEGWRIEAVTGPAAHQQQHLGGSRGHMPAPLEANAAGVSSGRGVSGDALDLAEVGPLQEGQQSHGTAGDASTTSLVGHIHSTLDVEISEFEEKLATLIRQISLQSTASEGAGSNGGGNMSAAER